MRALLLLPVAVVLGVFFAWPVALVLQEAANPDAWRWLADDYARGQIATALQQAFLSLALVLAIAVPVALLHHHRTIPGSRVLLGLQAAPFVLPVFVVVAGLRELLGRDGWADQVFGVDMLATVGPLGAVALANAYYNTGLAARLLHAALERRARHLEQAAAVLGAPPASQHRRVTLPLLAPAFAATALLVLLFCLGSFGVVLMLGGNGPGKVDTLDTLLHANLSGAFPREDRGAVLAVTQTGLQLLLLAGCLLLERKAARYASPPAHQAPKAHPALTALAWVLALMALVPALAVLVGGFRLDGAWSLTPWRTLLDQAAPGHLPGFDVGAALAWSLLYAAAAVAGSLVLTACLAYAARRDTAAARFAATLSALPLGTSSVVLGFGFLLAFTGRTWLPLFGSPVGIIAAHTLLAFPFTARVVLPAFASLDTRLDDAARVLGASPTRLASRVHWPLLRGPVAAAAGFAAALSLGDYGASLLLMTPDIMSLSVWTGRHGGPASFDPLARAQTSALAGLLLALTAGALAAFALAATHRTRRPA